MLLLNNSSNICVYFRKTFVTCKFDTGVLNSELVSYKLKINFPINQKVYKKNSRQTFNLSDITNLLNKRDVNIQ